MPGIQQSLPSTTTPLAIRQSVVGVKTVYVDDYVSAGSGNPSDPNYDWRPVIQAAHDAVAALIDAEGNVGQQWGGVVNIRGKISPYRVSGPAYWWHYNIFAKGEGNSTFLLAGDLNHDMGCPVFMLGWQTPKSCGGQFLANFTQYRPDCFGKVDTSLATAMGQRWGFRSLEQSFIQGVGTQLSHGATSPKFGYPYVDCWAETNVITIEFIVEGFTGSPGMLAPNAAPNSSNTLFGVTDNAQAMYPYWLVMGGSGNTQYDFLWMTQAVRGGPTAFHNLVFNQAAAGGVQRVAIQIDHINGAATTWVNGIQATTQSISTGVFLNENFQFPFAVANGGSYGIYSGPFLDFALYGLSMSTTPRYNVSTNGSTQTRKRDNAPYSSINDFYRYGDDGSDPGIIGYFAFTESPAGANPDMMLAIRNGGQSSPAFVSHPLQKEFIGGQGVTDMHIVNGRQYSTSLMVGNVILAEMSNLLLEGGLWGVANGLFGANYVLYFDTCSFSGTDAAFFGLFSIDSFINCTVARGGRNNFLFSECALYFSGNTFMSGAQINCQTSVFNYIGGSSGGGQIVVRNVIQDVESTPFPSVAGIKIQRNHAGGNILLEDIVCGDMVVPTIILDDVSGNGGFNDNFITINRVSSSPGFQSQFIQVNGNGFYGSVDNLVFGQSPPLNCLNTYSPGSSLQINCLGYPAPPHWGTWYSGTTALKVNTPGDGLYRLWECSRTGTYGSPTPPSWVGSKAYQSSPQTLAAVAVDHTCIATTAFGGSLYGWFSDILTADAIGFLFGQRTGFGAPSSIQFHLTTTPGLKNGGGTTEPSGGGYLPVSLTNNITNFPNASAGVKSNGVAIAWPALSAPITAVGFFMTDQSGSRNLGYVQFATPQTFAIGATPTIGIGALTFTQTPTNNPGFLTQFGWGKIFNRYFGGATLTPPATWYVGLNAALAGTPATAPTEPSGGGYARAPLTNDTTNWAPRITTTYVMTSNQLAATFPNPTGGGYGTALGIGIFDALTSGNCWWVADVPILNGVHNSVVCTTSPPLVAANSILLTM